jgi:hypothetical protein
MAELSARLATIWQRPVDVVDLWPQSPIFRHAVLAEGILLVDRDLEHRVHFEARTSSEYLDFLPTYALASEHAIDGFLDWLASRR